VPPLEVVNYYNNVVKTPRYNSGWSRSRRRGEIVAARIENGNEVRTRPLCAYPEIASYQGSGSTDDATNFRCKQP
jgi:hypothetical protein